MDNKLCIGLMSGTSMDGIDIALINTNGDAFIQSIAHQFYPYPPFFQPLMKKAEHLINQHQGNLIKSAEAFKETWQYNLSSLANPIGTQDISISALTDLFQQYAFQEITLANLILLSTKLHEAAVEGFLQDLQIVPKQIAVIGYHGQTVYHAPHRGITLQLGDASYLASKTVIPVVNQFRINDIKHGGQGAPLAPLYHWALAMQSGITPMAIVNCGGIANITFINSDRPEDLIAFDTGPGNVLLDRLVRTRTNGAMQYDLNGQFSLQGTVHKEALVALYKEGVPQKFFSQTPPKSLDSYDCILPAIFDQLSLPDACATLAEFTAQSIVKALRYAPQTPKCWVLAGGGWRNPAIANALSCNLALQLTQPPQICSAHLMGWHPDAIEAEAFAYLAQRVLLGLPISFPGTTGVNQPLTGGEIFYP